ncbi:MAG: winged helix-turn-helix transcriptional regulator, partial [Coprobacillus sp.]
LDDTYSFDAEMGKGNSKNILKGKKCTLKCTLTENAILDFIIENPNATQKDIAEAIGKSLRTIKNSMDALQNSGLLKREGSKKIGNWIVCNNDSD